MHNVPRSISELTAARGGSNFMMQATHHYIAPLALGRVNPSLALALLRLLDRLLARPRGEGGGPSCRCVFAKGFGGRPAEEPTLAAESAQRCVRFQGTWLPAYLATSWVTCPKIDFP